MVFPVFLNFFPQPQKVGNFGCGGGFFYSLPKTQKSCPKPATPPPPKKIFCTVRLNFFPKKNLIFWGFSILPKRLANKNPSKKTMLSQKGVGGKLLGAGVSFKGR